MKARHEQMALNHPATLCVAPGGLGDSAWGAWQAGHLHLPSLLPDLTPSCLSACLMDLAAVLTHRDAHKLCMRLPCHSPTHTAGVGKAGSRGLAPPEAQSSSHSSHSLAVEGILVPGPPQPPALSSSIPPATSQTRLCLGRQFCLWQWWGFASPWHSCWKPGIHRTLPRAGLISWHYLSITGCRNDLEVCNCICLPPLAPAGPGSLQPEGSDGQHRARPWAVHPSTHHSPFHPFLHSQIDPC